MFPVRLSKVWDFSQTNRLETLSGIIMCDPNDEERVRGFHHLHHLKCEYDNSWNFSPDLSSLTQLESLKIVFHNHFNSISMAVNLPNNIKKLSLYRISLSCKMMSSIGRLPNLEIPKLYYADLEGDNWMTDDHEFQKLKFLKLQYLYIPQWNTSREHFPRLEKLVLRRCYGPKVLPSELGYSLTLQMIVVYNCDHDVTISVIRIHEEQLDEGNEELKFIIFSRLVTDHHFLRCCRRDSLLIICATPQCLPQSRVLSAIRKRIVGEKICQPMPSLNVGPDFHNF